MHKIRRVLSRSLSVISSRSVEVTILELHVNLEHWQLLHGSSLCTRKHVSHFSPHLSQYHLWYKCYVWLYTATFTERLKVNKFSQKESLINRGIIQSRNLKLISFTHILKQPSYCNTNLDMGNISGLHPVAMLVPWRMAECSGWKETYRWQILTHREIVSDQFLKMG